MSDTELPPQPTCEKCLAVGPVEIDENARLRVEVLTDYDRVIELVGTREPTGFTHTIRLEGLRYHYRLDREIHCLLPDRQGHKEGFIVETACALTLNIGHVCGSKRIHGLAKLVEIRTRTDAYDSDVRTIDHDPAQMRTEVHELDRLARQLDEARLGLADYFSATSKYMRAAANQNPKLLSVIVDAEEKGLDGKTRRVQQTFTLRGAALWRDKPKPDAALLLYRLESIEKEIASERAKDPAFNESHASLARALRTLRRDLSPFKTWVSDATQFFANRNLELALHVAHVTDARVEDDGLIVNHDGKDVRVSARGVS